MAVKTSKSQTKRSPELTAKNKRTQATARARKADKRIGQAAQKRKAKREYLKEKRLTDQTFGRIVPKPDGEVKQNALNKDTRGKDQIIFSCTYTPHKD